MLWDVLAWDSALVAWCASVRTDDMTITGIWTSELASAGAVAGVVAVVGYLLYRSNRLHDLAGLVVSAGGSVLAAHLLKLATDRLRPPISVAAYIEAGSAFPSAHAAVAVGLYGFLAWLLWRDCDRQWWHRAAVVGTIALAAVIGTSRILLGVHYPSDVLAGYMLGGLFLYAGMLVTRRNKNRNLC